MAFSLSLEDLVRSFALPAVRSSYVHTPQALPRTLTYAYYMHCPEDPSITKLIVATIWTLDTLHVSFMCHVLYYYLITNYGNLASLDYIVWCVAFGKFTCGYCSSIVSDTPFRLDARRPNVASFFAHKIYHLCRRQLRWFLIAPIILFILVDFGFGIGTAVVMLVNNTLSYAFHTRFYTSAPATCAVVLAEILITVSLCVLLYDNSSRSAVPRTKRILNTLIVYAVNRCLLTLRYAVRLVTTAELTTVTDAYQTIAWPMALEFIVGKLYANSLLASLNSREHLRSQISSSGSGIRTDAICFANPPKLSGEMGTSRDGIRGLHECEVAIRVDTTTEPAFDKTTTPRREAEVNA
ncbi:hypothetical protein F5141DRAFT_1205977, partial [Pisolithus sp. B1]